MTTHKKGVMYVYNLDTENHKSELHHHPSTPPQTTIKKSISRSLGSLLRRSKTYREINHHVHHDVSLKEDTKEIVQELARKSVPTISNIDTRDLDLVKKEGRKTYSGNGEGRKLVSGIEVVGGRRSAENRAEMVMINIGEVAALLHVRVLVTDMPGFMQVHAFRCARQTFDSIEKFSPKQIALNMKKDFDKVYGPAWHCIVGSSFGSFVTHATGDRVPK